MAKRKACRTLEVTLSAEEKATVAAACEYIITELFKPRYLREIRPTEFNYPVDIFGRWRGDKYSFITRYRSGFPHNTGEEFDAAFTRLDYAGGGAGERRFDIMWHRHTGTWWRLHSAVTLEKALHLIKTEGLLHPL
ncbi:hypothetical protein G5V57_30730 [Nordella sp. HKS 07]|uniref:DUF3024 domain-containing protein n=1 Tax=Nordella sp. HKS 07 TaxID=2712222 RepID=UPI0013E13B77|nr:hypothetical protein [Nordella sp. HKS 07]QIG51706.1 hypothetical protein G5V57_30730 [Nordella sp. HKS 07]